MEARGGPVSVDERLLVESGLWEDLVSKSPLSTRGWVVQERLLSRRNLHFTPQEVFFECNQHAVCERFPDELPKLLCAEDSMLKIAYGEHQMREKISAIVSSLDPETSIYSSWHDILTKYTGCRLTVASDRLVAFAGIAKSFQARLDDQYIAGLWMSNLAYDMMWYRDSYVAPIVKDLKDRVVLFDRDIADRSWAPSFSWASTTVPIQFAQRFNSNRGFLVDASCIKFRHVHDMPIEEVAGDLYGPLLTSAVEVMAVGSLKRMRLLPSTDGIWTGTNLYVFPGRRWVSFLKLENRSPHSDRVFARAELDFQVPYGDIGEWAAKDNLYYMPWQDQYDSRMIGHRNKNLVCLLLELVDSSMSRFRRIGILFDEGNGMRKRYLARQGDESTFPCSHYDAEAEKHTIYIV